MRRNGFTDEEIRAHANELRHNALDTTARALKEHFILERIAEDEQIDADESDYDAEIRLIALQSGETPRRVRARLEKQDLMDVLRNQIVERKVIERVIEHAQFQEVPWKPEDRDVEALDHAVSGGTRAAEIPTATHGEAQPLKAPEERT
jgi:trigger factor